jgi:outer membrane immunogenic protein
MARLQSQGKIAALAAALLALPVASRADPWNGFYAGVFAGGAWGNGDIATDVGRLGPGSYFSTQSSIDSVERSASGEKQSQGFVGGVQFGANRRFDRFVIGAEVDYGAFNLGGHHGAADVQYPQFPFLYTVDTAYSTDWLLTGRGRLGWLASPDLLVFFTGGLAVSDVKVSNSFFDRNGVVVGAQGGSTSSRTKLGYTLGGGFEFAVSGPWSIKAEYLYVDLGKSTVASSIGFVGLTNPFDTSVDLTANVGRIGINYSFTD